MARAAARSGPSTRMLENGRMVGDALCVIRDGLLDDIFFIGRGVLWKKRSKTSAERFGPNVQEMTQSNGVKKRFSIFLPS